MKKRIFLVLLLVNSFSIVLSQNQNCTEFMKFGVYDKYRTFTSELQYKQIKDFFKNYQFSTKQQAQAKATEVGIDIIDILGLSFNGKSSSSNYEQWQQELIRSSFEEALSMGLKTEQIEKISDNITGIVQACLMKKGVHAYIVPAADKRNFTFTIDFIPHSSTKAFTKGSFSISPSSVAATAMPRDFVGKELEIGPQGVSISLTRLPSETVTIIYNTDEGSGSVKYDAFVTPRPSVTFKAEDENIKYGGSTKLRWNVDNAQRVELDGEEVDFRGNIAVYPEATKAYKLQVISLDGKRTSYTATVYVAPKPPVLVSATVAFNTTDDDKDDDTRVTVYIKSGGNTIASWSGIEGKWPDPSMRGPFNLNINSANFKKQDLLGAGQVVIVENPNGSDEWHFAYRVTLNFSDGDSRQIDGFGNLDHDRNTLSTPIP